MTKNYFAFLVFIVVSINISAQNSYWFQSEIKQTNISNSEIPSEHVEFTLNAASLLKEFAKAPDRLLQKQSEIVISLPNENGVLERYQLFEASNLHLELEAKFPEIKSYIGKGLDNGATARISYSPSLGLNVSILNLNRPTTLIASLDTTNGIYGVFSRDELNTSSSDFECETIESARRQLSSSGLANRNANDSNLRRYRAAISTTSEYSQFFLDGTETTDEERKEKVIAALNLSLTRINGIFERDFGVTMQLISNNDDIIFLDSSTDPYNVNNSVIQNTIDATIGDSNYDVGHLFAYEGSIYGNAGCIACVCTPGAKGSAYTVHSDPNSDHFNLIASHEFGHQFGGWHVQSTSNCRSSNELQEVEPGSGSSIMGYAGICSPSVQDAPDDYFNYVDIRDVAQWTINDSSCAEIIGLTNTAPTVSAGNDFTIPRSTAFILEGTGSDSNGDQLSFCWEENDPENPFSSDTPQPTRQFGPMFRSKLPVSSPDRYMPKITDVVNGNLTPTWEMLPSISRTMDFVLTVRDNNQNGGQTASDEMTVTVTDTAGPFVVTSQSTNDIWNVGENATITWDVANTNVAPVNATEVDIFLSVDGGFTYPYTIATAIANDGSETINIPNVPTTTDARVMVRGANQIFYAINSSNFEVQASEFVMNFTETNLAVCKPNDAVYNFTYNTFLGFDETTVFSALNLPTGVNAVFSQPSATEDNTNVQVTITNTALIANGSYDIIINGISDTAEKNITITLEVYDDNLSAPTLQFPEDNASAVDVNGTFTWQADVNAASYEIEIALDASFNTMVLSETTFVNSYDVLGLDYNTIYYWRVRSVNDCGISSYSNSNEFITFCVAPSDIALTNILSDSAEVSWIENGNATSWEIEVVEIGNTPTGVGVSTSNNPYTINGLNSLTSYDLYIRSECGGGNYSDWTGPLNFTTAANFCNGDHFYDSGGLGGNYSNGEYITTVIAPSAGNNSITVVFNSFELESGWDYLYVYDGPDNNAPFLGQYTGTVNPGPFTSSDPSGTLTFLFTSDGTATRSGWDATVTCQSISCPNPTDLLANDITLNSADISWIASGNESTWELEYGLTGFDLGTGTLINTSTNPTTLNDLTFETTYDVYLRGNCGANPGEDDSSWVGPFTFSTLGLEAPGYLTAELSDETLGEVTLNWGEPSSFIGSWMLFYDFNCADNYFQTEIIFNGDGSFIIPDFNDSGTWVLEGDQLTFTFPDGFSYSGTRNGDYVVGTNDAGGCWYGTKNNTDGLIAYTSGALDVFGQPNSNENQVVQVNVSGLSFIEYNLYRDAQLLTTTTELTYIDTLPNYGAYDYYVTAVYVEGESIPSNIETIEWVSCPEPFDFVAENASVDSIDLSWIVGGSETSWELEYGLSGFTIGAGNTVIATSNPYTLTGLNSSSNYDVYVRANCGTNPGEDDSHWVGPVSFTTFVDYCNGDHFYDSGGVNGNYQNGEDITTVITPSDGNNSVTVLFNSFQTESCCDRLWVYDGLDINAPLIGQYGGITIPNSFTSNNPSGALTFRFTSDGSITGSGWDATVICETITCPDISNIVVDGMTQNSADLSWLAGGNELSWEIEYGSTGFSQGTGTFIDTSNPEYTLTGLNSLTTFDVYIRGNCGVNPVEDDSNWVGPISFATLPDFCSGDHFYDSGGASGNYQNGEDITTVITPSDGNNSVTVIFNSFQLESCCDYLRVYDGLDINAPFIGQYNGSTIPNSFTADNPSGALTFRFTSDGSVTRSGWDATVVCETITCPDLSDFAVNNVTLSSADLSWIAGGSEMAWEIEYGPTGFMPGNGTTIISNTNPYALENLDLATTYDVYIRGNCGANPDEDDSNWIGPLAFTTLDITSPAYLVAELTDSAQGEVSLDWGPTTNFVGNWLLNFDHQCNGSYSQTEIIFYEDFTFYIPSEGVTGTWEVDGNQVIWTYNSGFQYTGTISGNYMEGTMGTNGCWFADRIEATDYINYTVGNISSTVEINPNANEQIVINAAAFGFLEYNIYRNNVLLASTTETTYVDMLTVSGTYDYHITSVFSEGESDASNIETIVWESLNVKDNEFEGIDIFPNPVTSELHINSTTIVESIEVFSMLGQKIMDIKSNGNNTRLDMTQLESGTYFVKVWANQRFNIYKVIKK
ncbi:CUB domain-containing protein [Winogradskyella forsetii]|uniref:CUB domain-containing protein n=1 Tax=Winogradskyella forsetii TaxID=2686077 RepID=UPI0015C12FC9|nr:CUB domain-containing protein [Winogradskyella forsetii]